MTFNLLELPLLFGCVVGLGLLAFYLRGPLSNRLARISFVSVLLVGVWQLFVFALMFSGNIAELPHLTLTGFPMEFLVGPLFYLYSAASFGGRRKFRWLDSLHLIPYFFAIFSLREIYFLSAERKVEIFAAENQSLGPLPVFWLVLFVSILVSKAFYFVLFIRNLRRFERTICNRSADSVVVENIKRYRRFAWMFFGYVCFFLVLLVYLSTSHLYGLYADYIWYVAKSSWLFAFAFFAISSGSKLVDSKPLELVAIEVKKEAEQEVVSLEGVEEPIAKKYAKSGLPEKRSSELLEVVLKFMKSDTPYLDGELSLVSLSEKLKMHPNHLSQVVNQDLGLSFSDFINEYRIGYAKTLLSNLEEGRRLNVLEIAFESGFSSRPSFNRVFKKATSMTPSQYRQKLEF